MTQRRYDPWRSQFRGVHPADVARGAHRQFVEACRAMEQAREARREAVTRAMRVIGRDALARELGMSTSDIERIVDGRL